MEIDTNFLQDSCKKLTDPRCDLNARISIANQLRENSEILQSLDPLIYGVLVPACIQVLNTVNPAFKTGALEHQLRHSIIDILHRLPQHDSLKDFSSDLMECFIQLLKVDNEDNGVLALKIVVELFKAFKVSLESHVDPFFDLVYLFYNGLPSTIELVFGKNEQEQKINTGILGDLDTSEDRILVTCQRSFKVLTECPIIIAMLVQIYKSFHFSHVPKLIPSIIKAISLQPDAQRIQHEKAEKQNQLFFGVAAGIKNRVAYNDLKALQVKTVSFVAYILRSLADNVKQYEHVIADSVIQLMKDCPSECPHIRKELLVATRHIWYTDFRAPFVKYIDILLNEELLLGSGMTGKDSLRPLAHSVLVDLIHHVRSELSIDQISKSIFVYSRILHDSSFAPNIQTMCAKLLANLADCISQFESKEQARILLFRILQVFSTRVKSFSKSMPVIVKAYQERLKPSKGQSEIESIEVPIIESYLDIGVAQPIKSTTKAFDHAQDLGKDVRFLFKNLVQGTKSVVFGISKISENPMGETEAIASGLNREQLDVLGDIFYFGLDGFDSFILDGFDETGNFAKGTDKQFFVGRDARILQDEKDTVDSFASIFVTVEACAYQEIVSSRIEHLVFSVMRNNALAAVCQCFVTTNTVSQLFCGVLSRHLMDNYEKLGSDDKLLAETLLKLFKLVFMAITYYPDKIEQVLQPHMAEILLKTFKFAATAEDPYHFYQVLRALFRAIAGGRYEILYQEVVPYLQITLENLNSLLSIAASDSQKEVFAELCLTVPVRLSVLLPYLSYLLRPLVCALNAGTELASQALRTLELCLDNLTREFLDPIFAPAFDEILQGLWRQIKSESPANSQSAIRILGKLGGKNRVLEKISSLNYKEYINDTVLVDLTLAGGHSTERLSLDTALKCARDILFNSESNSDSVLQAFGFVKNFLPLMIETKNSSELAEPLLEAVGQLSSKSKDKMEIDEQNESPFIEPPKYPRDLVERHNQSLKLVLESILLASTIESVKEEATRIWLLIIDFYVALSITRATDSSINRNDIDALVDALGSIVSLEKSESNSIVKDSLLYFKQSSEKALKNVSSECLEFYEKLALKFVSLCYCKSFHEKAGGCFGINTILSSLDLPREWFLKRQVMFVKALLYLLKDSSELLSFSNKEAIDGLFVLFRLCHNGTDVEKPAFTSLVSLLMSELSDPGPFVREAVQRAFTVLSEITNTSITDILTPAKERFLGPIYTKPLRALPFQMQIGNIDAITYCLSLEPPLLTFNDELIRLLHECLALADAEDSALAGKTSQYKNATSLISLRVVCIKLLSSAMICNEFSQAKQEHIRSRIISVFFKSLYSKSSEVVDVANKGLQQVLSQQHKLPKNLLQAGLRPILVNLSDHKRLTVPGLQGLARLLELLTNYFKVEIGKKLLDHLRQWAEPKLLEQCSIKLLSEVEEIKIMVAILDVFHLLPPAANVFLDELVKEIIELESKVKRVGSSPFRLPLLKFLNRYAQESVTYFYSNISSAEHQNLLIGLVKMTEAVELRSDIIANAQTFIEHVFDGELDQFGFELLNIISGFHPDWIPKNNSLLKLINNAWDKLMESAPQYEKVQGEDTLFNILPHLLISVSSKDIVSSIFQLLRGLENRNFMDDTLIRKFVFDTIKTSNLDVKQKLLNQALKSLSDRSCSDERKIINVRFVLVPIICESQNETVINNWMDTLVAQLDKVLFSPLSVDDDTVSEFNEPLILELLQLTILALLQNPNSVEKHKKNFVKFGFQLMKHSDMICKHAAYVLLAKYVELFDAPTKLGLGLFVALLKSHQPESKVLVKQALDTLMSSLPSKIQEASIGAGEFPVWVRWTRKVLDEEGHTLTQLVAIFHLLTRHSDLYRPFKELFLHDIVSALPKLALNPSASLETRMMCLDFGDMLSRWISESKQMDVDESTPSTGRKRRKLSRDQPAASKPLELSLQTRESIVNFYLKLTLALQDTPNVPPQIVIKSVEILQSFSDIWDDVKLNIVAFEKLVPCDVSPERIIAACNQLDVLSAVVKQHSTDWISENISPILQLISPWSRIDHLRLIVSLEQIYRLVFACRQTSTDAQGPLKAIETMIQCGLYDMGHPLSLVTLVDTFYETSESVSNSVLGDVVKLLQKLVNGQSVASQIQPNTQDLLVYQLCSLLKFLKKRVILVPDLRKQYLTLLSQLIESIVDEKLVTCIMDIASEWATSSEMYPSIKEKALLLQKMTVWSGLPSYDRYLNLIADIYSDSELVKTDFSSKLETAFLHGLMSDNIQLRIKFYSILDSSIGTCAYSRLKYVIGIQNWAPLNRSFWITQALQLLLGSNWSSAPLVDVAYKFKTCISEPGKNSRKQSHLIDSIGQLNSLVSEYESDQLLNGLVHLCFYSQTLVLELWPRMFASMWKRLSYKEQTDIVKHLVQLLAKDYHLKVAEKTPNVIQSLLLGVSYCSPKIVLPPQLLKFLAKTFNCWHCCLDLLDNYYEENPVSSSKEDDKIRENTMDAQATLYKELKEVDYFVGHWRRRAQFQETVTALSFEQISDWEQAQLMFENVQLKARTGILPFTPAEYTLWEDHWVDCGKKLQQWDLLTDLAKHEGDTRLLIDSAWRISDWHQERETLDMSVKSAFDQSSPHFHAYQAILVLLGDTRQESLVEFAGLVEKGITNLVKKWNSLPDIVSTSHHSCLNWFQRFVELQEAAQIQQNLIQTTAQNIETKTGELKSVLTTWRERLPNVWDDIGVWSDLVAWRQHVFSLINKAYIPLIPLLQQSQQSSSTPSSSYGYRGYHETAWIINRFAHVARKQELTEVCINSLSKIYTLPNIEIQEAFYKLREQAKCHLANPSEFSTGLDVINNTNLMYFSPTQKAEFFTLKGIFLSKLGLQQEAEEAFSSATQIDLYLPRAWGCWGEYHDRLFKEKPLEMKHAQHALNCYLQVSSLLNNYKSRKYLARILWLLSQDDEANTISSAFETFKQEPQQQQIPVWSWITFIPQLLSALQHKEANSCRHILMLIAKAYPQALHFQLRTTKEEFLLLKKQLKKEDEEPSTEESKRMPWEHVEEITGLLKTAFPLLTLSIETMIEQVLHKLKPSTDEDIYRLIVALMNDGIQQLARDPADSSSSLSSATEMNLQRFAESMYPNHVKYKQAFEDEFIKSKPTLTSLVDKFRSWRDKLEVLLDARPSKQPLEQFSHYLIEFENQKFDEIEMLGQYNLQRESPKDFIRIDRFEPELELIRGHGGYYKRLAIRGHDGSVNYFAVQHPASRGSRREEKIVQLFQIFNSILANQVESKNRGLEFSLPAIIPLAPQVRLVMDDPSNVTLQQVYEEYCKDKGIYRDQPLIFHIQKMKEAFATLDISKKSKVEVLNLKTEIMQEITSLIPDTLLTDYVKQTIPSPNEYFCFRKRFTMQYATCALMSWLFSLGHRQPHKIHFSRETGSCWISELSPTISSNTSLYSNQEAIPFRLTPNIQKFMTVVGMEGPFTGALMALAKSLTEPENQIQDYLNVFIRDDILAWQSSSRRPALTDAQLVEKVLLNVDLVSKRTLALACVQERTEKDELKESPANQTILDLIAQAVNPLKLAQMDITFIPQL